MSTNNTNWINTQITNDFGTYLSNVGQFNNAVAGSDLTIYGLENTLISPSFFETITHFFESPNESITHILIYPFDVPSGSTRKNLKIGNITTDIKCWELAKGAGFYTVFDDYIYNFYNDFRDYEGYTNIRAYLPFLGYVDIPTNEVMGKKMSIYLCVDFYTGVGMYYICVTDDSVESGDNYNNRIISKHRVNLAIDVPLTTTTALETTRNLLLASARIVSTVATAGLTNSTTTTGTEITSTTARSVKKGKPKNAPKGSRLRTYDTTDKTTESVREINTTSTKDYSRDTVNSVISTASSAMTNAFTRTSSDHTLQPALEQWASKTVKIVIQTYRYASMGDYAKYVGKPLQSVVRLNTLTGYTEVGSIHLTGFSTATKAELDLIENALHSGIIL